MSTTSWSLLILLHSQILVSKHQNLLSPSHFKGKLDSWITQAPSLPIHDFFLGLADKVEDAQLNLNFNEHFFFSINIFHIIFRTYVVYQNIVWNIFVLFSACLCVCFAKSVRTITFPTVHHCCQVVISIKGLSVGRSYLQDLLVAQT